MGTAVLSLTKSQPDLALLPGLTLLEEVNPPFW